MAKNNVMRSLDKSALEEALLELNDDFLNDLPDSSQNLFKYTSRRVDPEISSSINYDLGRKMLNYRLSDKEYFMTFLKIVRYTFNGKKTSKSPKSNILLSQTGAGKSNLRGLILRRNPNFVVIDSDKFKKFRFDANDIFEKDAQHFAALTVGNLISAFSIHKRYERDVRDKKMKCEAKLTDLGRHNNSYDAMIKVIRNIDSNNLFIYRRGTKNENYVPVLVDATNKLEKFEELQYKSNISYAEEQKAKKMPDYNEIKRQMEERQAVPEQLEQLEQIRECFLMFCLKEYQVCNDSLEK